MNPPPSSCGKGRRFVWAHSLRHMSHKAAHRRTGPGRSKMNSTASFRVDGVAMTSWHLGKPPPFYAHARGSGYPEASCQNSLSKGWPALFLFCRMQPQRSMP